MRLILTITSTLCFVHLFAQQKEGRVTYQRVMELNIQLSGAAPMPQVLPRTRTTFYELNFSGNEGTWRQSEDAFAEESGNENFSIRTFSGADNFTYFDLEGARTIQQTELAGKNYVVTDSIGKSNWKLTQETKTILGHTCYKAIATIIGNRTAYVMENGKMERKPVTDTSITEAWFTTDIPVSFGPEVPGQLPGLVLELSQRSGRVVYTATDISLKVDRSALNQPSKGRKMTGAEFAKERAKVFEKMEQNQGGAGGTRITVIQ